MNRTDRLYAITEELRRAGTSGRTADQLAAQFEMSTRTIKRDITALQQADSPIWARTGPGGGYVLAERASMPPVNFTPAQAIALAVALSAGTGTPYADAGRAALAKLLDAMDPASRHRAQALAARVWVNVDPHTSARATRVIEQGLERRLVVVLDYADAHGKQTRRPIEPHLLAYDKHRWYVIAWCLTRDDVRWFRLDRVRRATLTRRAVEERPLSTFGEPPASARPMTRSAPM